MDGLSVAELVPSLQTAIGPVILISGVGLLLLSMTNRLGRIIDRSRTLAGELADASESRQLHIQSQLQILWARGRLIRLSISLAAVSVLCAAILIIVIFFTALLNIDLAWLIVALFVVAMLSLIVSLVAFIDDIYRGLAALKLELEADNAQIS